MIKAAAKRAVRRILESAGYRAYHRDVLPFGIEYMYDIERLAGRWHLPIRTFFDIGANVGQTSKLALAAFLRARVFAFEPHPGSFSKLVEGLGNHPEFSAHNVAVADHPGPVTLFEYSSSTLNSLVPDAQYVSRRGVTAREIAVDCTTVDEFCTARAIEFVDVLKIDTEGCELPVLQGARRMLANERIRFIYAEFNDLSPRNGSTGGALTPVGDFLTEFGFRFIATYPEYMEFDDEMHVAANVLFVRPPAAPKHDRVGTVAHANVC